jgi:pre-mRNA-splicing factor ISY1
MARPSEMKQHMFSRWVQMNRNDAIEARGGEVNARRPHLASECDSVTECERWHKSLAYEITKKMELIDNANLGEMRLRELNDEVNKLVRTKGHWLRRIRELGGDISTIKRHHFEIAGVELPGSRGYKYYGAAKDLPGVRELFDAERSAQEVEKSRKRSKNKHELMKGIVGHPEYWGKDDPHGPGNNSDLLQKELSREKVLVRQAVREAAEKAEQNAADMARAKAGMSSKSAPISVDLDSAEAECAVDVLKEAMEQNAASLARNAAKATGGAVVVEATQDPAAVLMEAKKQALLNRFKL